MRFITEIDLRYLYNDKAFTVYKIDRDVRLTPGARQFLTDKRIKILNNDISKKRDIIKKEKSDSIVKEKNDWRYKKLLAKINSLEAVFFLSIEEILDRDIVLAQEIAELSKAITKIKKSLKTKTLLEPFEFNECLGMKRDESLQELEFCFDITDFHIQLKGGKDILILHRLRCLLGEIEPVILELCEYNEEDIKLYQNISGNINQIINILSQKICCIVGGGKCQRKT